MRGEKKTMSRFILISLLVILTAAAGLFPAGNVAARQDAVATLVINSGSATVTPQNGDPQEYKDNDVALVNQGDEVAISDDGEALLTFFEGTQSRLVAGTVITVDQLSAENNAQKVSLSVSAGQAMNTVATMVDADSRFEVDTPAATITVRGTNFIVFVRPNDLTQVATLAGLVDVSAQDQTVQLPPGFGVKVAPGEAPGTVNVWAQALVIVSAPDGVTTKNLPVTFVNTANDQIYRYRSEDLMTVLTGPYEMTVNTPAPYRLTGIEFPTMTEPGKPTAFDVALGALILNTDSDTGDLIVHFAQGDLSGETTVAPGAPILVAPGTWSVEVALASDPTQVQTFEITAVAGETLTRDLLTSDFGPATSY
jgi:hypothetical protein